MQGVCLARCASPAQIQHVRPGGKLPQLSVAARIVLYSDDADIRIRLQLGISCQEAGGSPRKFPLAVTQFLIAILPVKTGTSKWCPSVWLTSSNGWALCQEHDLGVLGAVVGVPKITLHTGHPPVQTEYAQFLGKVQAKVLRTG
eukprot:645395-Pelagomonas_calceolata.AAC.3